MNEMTTLSTLVRTKLAAAREHYLLPNAKAYDLRNICFRWDCNEYVGGWIEMELSTHEDYAIIQFLGVRDISIPSGDNISSVCIRILDTGEYMPEFPAPIRVEHPAGGGLSFWAETIVRIK